MKNLRLKTGEFAKGQKQRSIFSLRFKNENGKVYTVKLPFNRFICITILN